MLGALGVVASAAVTPTVAHAQSTSIRVVTDAAGSRLNEHDTNASWSNAAYRDDYVASENNMNEEWWRIAAKGPPDARGLLHLCPRAAYYGLQQAYDLPACGLSIDLAAIRRHFAAGDFFGLYREANYGRNMDIYNGEAPLGMEFTGKRRLEGPRSPSVRSSGGARTRPRWRSTRSRCSSVAT